MPELPEVEVVRAGLAPAVTGATVAAVTVFDERSLRRHPGPSEDFRDRLEGRSFSSAERRGKFLWLPMSTGPVGGEGEDAPEALVVHLGMSGQVLLRDRATDDALTRIRIELDHPAHGPLRLNFVDQRIFGSMAIDRLVAAGDGLGDALPSQVAHIARDPLDPHFDDRLFLDRLARRNTGVKRALLDQTLLSGVGNIYADEALWAARVHYDQPTSTGRGACSPRCASCWPGRSARAARASTPSTSTSTGRPATSPTRSTRTASTASRARAAGGSSCGSRS